MLISQALKIGFGRYLGGVLGHLKRVCRMSFVLFHSSRYTNPGDTFGELALLYNCPRAATVTCDGDCTLWALERNGFAILVRRGV